MEYTSCQKNAFSSLMQWWESGMKQYFVLCGFAGTGKSTILEELIGELKTRVKGGAKKKRFDNMDYLGDFIDDTIFNVKYCCFTGKAAQVLRAKGLPAVTIHKLIYRTVVDLVTEEISFEKKSKKDMTDIDLIVVDEASMVNRTIFNDLLSFGIPLVFVGDLGQLPSIAEVGEAPFNVMEEYDVFMTSITRQAADSPIIHLATMAREGKNIPLKIYSKDVMVVPANKMKMSGLLKGDQVICGRNATRQKINEMCREYLGNKSKFPQNGDKLICVKNNFDLGLVNGMLGRCTSLVLPDDFIYSGEMSLGFKPDDDELNMNLRAYAGKFHESAGEERFKFSKKEMRELEFFEYGYAITGHKSQGSQFPYTIAFDEPFGSFEDKKKWRYTVITRAVEKLVLLRGTPDMIQQ